MSAQFLLVLLAALGAAAWFLRGALASFRGTGSCASGCGSCGKACPLRAVAVPKRP